MTINETIQQSHCSTAELKKATETRLKQSESILRYLKKHGSLSTLEAYQMRILSPASRILELRQQGHSIKTMRNPKMNGMATYVLAEEGGYDE